MSISRFLLKVILPLLIASSGILTLHSQGVGPQVFPLNPKNMTLYNLFYMDMRSNLSPSSDLIASEGAMDIQIVTAPLFYTFSVKGSLARIMVMPNYGWIGGSVEFNGQTFPLPDQNGFGDTEVMLSMGILNTPALSLIEFASWKPKFQVNMVLGIGIPTGAYDANQLVNMGSNRWAFRIGVPVIIPLNKEIVRAARWEVFPSIFLYTRNNEFLLGSDKSQNPLFTLEQHFTKNFSESVWISADLHYQYGGRAEVNNTPLGDPLNQFGTGATLAYAPAPGITLLASYGMLWFDDDNGRMLRVGVNVALPSKADRQALKSRF